MINEEIISLGNYKSQCCRIEQHRQFHIKKKTKKNYIKYENYDKSLKREFIILQKEMHG